VIWLTWRQHRGQVLALAAGLVGIGLVMMLTGLPMHDAFRDTGLARCLERQGSPVMVSITDNACVELGSAFAARFFNQRLLALILFIVLPALVGAFLGAPVVARELEQGTHQLVWTQGVGRTRWAVTKISILAAVVVAAAALFALLVQWWFEPLNRATGERFTWLIFDQQGLAPIGYTLFAFALGVLLGAMTRRTVRAIGLSIAVFFAARFAVAVWVRPDFLPRLERTYPVAGDRIPNPLLGDFIIGGGGPGVGGVYDAAGNFLHGGQTLCPPPEAADCIAEVGRGAVNLEIYQSASRYWLFQGIETALFVAVSVVLLVAAVAWIRRRLT
jgi:hypothetical protein